MNSQSWVQVYRVSLRCLPDDFRARYENDLTSAFEDLLLTSGQSAGWIWLRATIDLVRWAVKLRLRRRETKLHRAVKRQEAGLSDMMLQDMRYSLRQLVRAPGSSLTIIATLGILLAANASLFSVVNATLLEPLPFHAPDRVVFLMHRYADMVGSGTAPLLVDYRRELKSFQSVSASYPWNANLTGAGEAERLQGLWVSADFFATLGVEPRWGRGFAAEEERPGEGKVVVLSDRLWTRRFGAESSTLGSSIELNGESYEVVGIMPAGFHWGRGWGQEALADVWAPYELTPERIADGERGSEYLDIHARLAPGVSADEAQAELDQLRLVLREQFPERYTEVSGWRVEPVPLHAIRVRALRPALMFVFAAGTILLLIAATNVAGLRMARASGRRKEWFIRTALGASRGRLVRQMMTETAVLAIVSAGLGLLAARLVIAWLEGIGRVSLPRAQPIELDISVLGFTLIATLVTTLICGFTPAWLGSRRGASSGASAASSLTRIVGAERTSAWTQRFLVIAQTGLALALLVGTGLMLRSVEALERVSPGYRTDNLLAARISLPRSRYQELSSRTQFIDELVARVSSQPGVRSVGLVSELPLSGDSSSGSFQIEGVEDRPDEPAPHAENWSATPEYFRTMGIRIVRGRRFDERDSGDRTSVVIVNETLARKYFPDVDPLGKRLDFGGGADEEDRWSTIVGVVGDVHDRGLDERPRAQLYTPFAQRPFRDLFLVLHADREPLGQLPVLRQTVAALDEDLPLFAVTTIERLVLDDSRERRVATWMLTSFSITALLLAALGLYGLLSYLVREKTAEIGLRVALGASRSALVGSILADGARLIAFGLAVGIALSLFGTRLLASLVFEVETTDALTYGLVTLTLTLVALVASALPAWRATRIDPTRALRQD